MNWKVRLDEILDVVILTYEGFASAKDIYDSSIATIDLTNKYVTNKILVEARNLITNSSRADIFKMPSKLYAQWGMDATMRIALIEPKELSARSIAQFYEIACRNLGWETKIFRERKSAVKWLNE